MTDDIDNIRPFRVVSANEDAADPTETLPADDYVIECLDGTEFTATGFLLFTSHHVAVMRDTGTGAKPVLMVPLTNVRAAELIEDDDEEDAPF